MKKTAFRTVFCCAKCLGYVKYRFLDVNQVYAKVCLPCTTTSVRKTRTKMSVV